MMTDVFSFQQKQGGKLVQDSSSNEQDDAEDVAHSVGSVRDGQYSCSNDGLDNDSDGEWHIYI